MLKLVYVGFGIGAKSESKESREKSKDNTARLQYRKYKPNIKYN
jgi:hypothetical protein